MGQTLLYPQEVQPLGNTLQQLNKPASLFQGGRGTACRDVGCYKEDSTPWPNITREEQKALQELIEDNTKVVLTADKGVCFVVMDKEEYIKKAKSY